MPVIPSFDAFAATPNTGEAWLGGQRIQIATAELGIQQQRIAQQAAEAAQRAQVAYAQIANQRAMAQMELQAKQVTLEQQRLQREQELEIQKQYQEAQLGLRAREVASTEARTAEVLAEQARQQEGLKVYNEVFQRERAAGRAADDAHAAAMAAAGPGFAATSAYQQTFRRPEEEEAPITKTEGGITFYQRNGQWYPLAGGLQEDPNAYNKRAAEAAWKELETLKKEDIKDARFGAIASKVMFGDPKAIDEYERMERYLKAAVDAAIARKRRMMELDRTLPDYYRQSSQYGTPPAMVPTGIPGSSTNRPAITGKTAL